MKKEVILVPKDKCVMDILKEMGDKIKSSWIFFHKNVMKQLKKTADGYYFCSTVNTFIWNATEKTQKIELFVDMSAKIWCPVIDIKVSDIAFEKNVEDPENIYFFQMAI